MITSSEALDVLSVTKIPWFTHTWDYLQCSCLTCVQIVMKSYLLAGPLSHAWCSTVSCWHFHSFVRFIPQSQGCQLCFTGRKLRKLMFAKVQRFQNPVLSLKKFLRMPLIYKIISSIKNQTKKSWICTYIRIFI